MRKFFFALIFMLTLTLAETCAAEDFWIMTENIGGDKHEWYVQTDSITEEFDNLEFFVMLKLVLNDERATNYPQIFRYVQGEWYAKQANSTADFIPVNSRELYRRTLDACKPYSKLAQNYDAVPTARKNFELRAVEGKIYSVRIVGRDEERLHDWLWAQGDEIYSGKYSAYLAAKNSSTFALQDAELFADAYSKTESQRINVTRSNRDGFHKVSGVKNLPDLLISKIQITGGGVFNVKIFVVKDGKLRHVKFSDDGNFRDAHDTGFEPITYLGDGKISLPWWTNAPGSEGRYVTVYRFDTDNLILFPAYTRKTS